MSRYSKNVVIVMLVAILIGAASWAFYSIINQGASDILKHFGVINEYYQSAIVIVFTFAFLLIVGFKGKSIIKKILGI